MARPHVRHTAPIEGDFVVFLIGARLVKSWHDAVHDAPEGT